MGRVVPVARACAMMMAVSARGRWSMKRFVRSASIALGLLISGSSCALDINVVGLFPGKAVVQVDGGPLQTLSVGQKSREGAMLISANRDAAIFDVDGERMTV